MRRMRDFFNGWVITLVVTAGIGYFAVRHWPSHPTDANHTSTAREVASESDKGIGKTRKPHAAKHVTDEEKLAVEEHEVATLEHGGLTTEPAPHAVSRDACANVEYRGNGPQAGRISTEEWGRVMTQFHYAKRDLLAWLAHHRGDFTKEVAEHMESDVKELRLQRPPTPDYPDLAFRGIGLWTRPAGERPIIKLGGGFAKLAGYHPTRAKFELARLIAQTWTPCEVKGTPIAGKTPAEGPWNKLLNCLGVQEDLKTACAPGGFSEGGWAVSTAIAAVAAPAGCTIPAFAAPTGDRCLDDLRSHDGPRAPAATKTAGKEAHHE